MPMRNNNRRWEKFSRIKTVLKILLPVLILATLATLAIVLKPGNICNTDACQNEANRLINRMDPTVDPCDNFYQFACGKTLEQGNQKNIITYMKERDTENILRLYKQSIKYSEHKAIQMSKKLFQNCLKNEKEIERDSLRRIQQAINEVVGWTVPDWPNFDWLQTTYRFRDLGYPFSMFLDVKVIRNQNDLNKYVLKVDKANIREESIMNKYSQDEVSRILVKIATLIGASNETYSLQEMNHVLDFKQSLSNVSYDYEEDRLTIDQFQEEYDKIKSIPFDWFEFLSKIVGKHVKLSSTDYVWFLKPDSLNKWINLISTSSKKAVANYMIWKIIETQLPYLPDNIKQTAGYEINVNREKFCLEECEKRFPVSPMQIAYAREALPSEKRQQVEKLFAEVKSQFLENIAAAIWIETNDKAIIAEKVNSSVLVYGLPGDYSTDKILDSLDVNFLPNESESFLDLLAQANRNHQTLLYKQLNVLPSDNVMNRAYLRDNQLSSLMLYKLLENEFYIPIGWARFLQEDIPNYGKYPPLGALIINFFQLIISGHDYEGLGLNYISEETREAVKPILGCLKRQIENLGEDAITLSQGMEFAVAEKISYLVYKKWIQAHGEEQKLPGLDYTPGQLFWILATFCHIPDPNLKSVIFNQVSFHANAVLVSKFNNPHFAKDFNCSPGSKANPISKCDLVL